MEYHRPRYPGPLAGPSPASSVARRDPLVDWFDRRIVQYVLLWSSWGALLDEDVYPLFGMRASKLNERFNRIVAALSASEQRLNDGDRDLLARARRHQQSRRAAEKAQPPQAGTTQKEQDLRL